MAKTAVIKDAWRNFDLSSQIFKKWLDFRHNLFQKYLISVFFVIKGKICFNLEKFLKMSVNFYTIFAEVFTGE